MKYFILLTNACASWILYSNSLALKQGFLQFEQARRGLYQSSADAWDLYCRKTWPRLRLEHKDQGTWSNSCEVPIKSSGSLARYWRLSLVLKYRVLFLGELPINMTIVIYC